MMSLTVVGSLLALMFLPCWLLAQTATADVTGTTARYAGTKPNVVVLFVDDWGWGDMGENCLHAAEVPGAQPHLIDRETSCDTAAGTTITPAMDALAHSGIRFTDFHVGAAVCTPSRAALQVRTR